MLNFPEDGVSYLPGVGQTVAVFSNTEESPGSTGQGAR